MDLQLSGQAAIVTGSSRGIGAAIAQTLAREGVSVVVNCARDMEGAESVCGSIEAAGGTARICRADVGDPAAAAELVRFALDQFGRLDILVNNAGISARVPFLQTTQAELDRILNTNLRGTWNCSQTAAAHMVHARYGRILNCASLAARIPQAGSAAYSASKAAIIALTRTLAGELAPHNILVNCYVPGTFDTLASRHSTVGRREEALNAIPLRRFGRPEEMGPLAAFLVSPLNSFMSGALIDVNGGKLAIQNAARPWRDAGLID